MRQVKGMKCSVLIDNAKAHGLGAGITVALVFPFMIFIYAPLEMFFYNQDDFWFDVYDLLPVILPLFLGSAAIAAVAVSAVCIFVPRLYKAVLAVSCITLLCSYIQGNFMIHNLPPLDGTEINWDHYSTGRIQSVVLWVIVTLFICILLKVIRMEKFCKFIKVTGICMTLMLFVTLTSICITTRGYTGKIDALVTVKGEYTMSRDTNFIIFILDAVDSETWYEMLAEHSEYREIFEDFTYYPDTMAVYPFTKYSVPFMICGEWYENQIPFQEYNVNAYKNSSFLGLLEEKGYELNMYEEELPLLDRSIYRFANVPDGKYKVSSFWDFAKLEIKLVGLRYAPFDLKRACIFNTNRFSVLRDGGDAYPLFSMNNDLFYQSVLEEEITYCEEKQFKFIHIEGAHVPFQYDKDVNIIKDGTYEENIEATMTITKAYLDKLREADVFHNSIIIVMADHGYSLTGPDAFGRQNPILLVKGLEEHHEMQVSETQVSFEDLQEAYVRLLNNSSGEAVFDCLNESPEKRRFIYYVFEKEDYMFEYIQTGHAFDDSTMKPTGNVYIRDEHVSEEDAQ